MATLRTRLTVTYGAALIGGLTVFAVALYVVRVASGVDALGPAAIDRLACALVPVHAHPGSVVVQQGDAGDHFYIVTWGRVGISVDGQEVREERAGESFGEIALLRSVPRTATVRAIEATEMVLLERGPFLEAITGVPASTAAADALIDARLATNSPARTEEEANARA